MSLAIPRRIGAHVSAAGGVHLAIERAASIGGNCVQLFSGSPRVWHKPALNTVDPVKISSNVNKYHVSPIFIHAIYLVNLASNNPELVTKSVKSLEYELAFDSLIGGAGVIVHLGSHQGRGFEAMQQQLVERITEILTNTPENSTFLIENSAGQKGKIGSQLEEVCYLLTELEQAGGYVSKKRLGWCFDTCHAFAAGYHLGDSTKLAGGEQSALVSIGELDLWSTLRLVHVNDSRDPFASGRDRHANLGDGLIPAADLRSFLNQPEITHIPLILEVPGLEKKGPDEENVVRLQELVGEM